jgi:Tfp pilus assembly protein PilW
MSTSPHDLTTKLRIAVAFIADRLKDAGFSERPNSRSRVGDLAPDI